AAGSGDRTSADGEPESPSARRAFARPGANHGPADLRHSPGAGQKWMAVLLVEQDVAQALRIADQFQCLLEGRTTLEGKPAGATTAQIEAAYFGLAGRAGPGSAA